MALAGCEWTLIVHIQHSFPAEADCESELFFSFFMSLDVNTSAETNRTQFFRRRFRNRNGSV